MIDSSRKRPARFWGLQLPAILLFLLLFLAGRLELAGKMVNRSVAPIALLSEALFALGLLGIAELLRRAHWILMVLLLIALSVLYLANLEMVFAMQTVVNLQEFGWTVDETFLQGSGSALSFPGYGLLLVLSALLLSLTRATARHVPLRYNLPVAILPFFALLLINPILVRDRAEEPWESSSLLWIMSKTSLLHRQGAPTGAGTIEEGNVRAPKPEEAPVESERDWNILMLVLEGIPGVYLRQVQESTGVEHPVVMEHLSNAADDFVLFPHTVSHNRQTIRGLYAMLTGDYPAFRLSTPRAYRYMSRPPDRRPAALPQLLASAGYRTVYLQAAPLGYMSKDQVMKAVGFQQILGREHFSTQYVDFGWGPDDRAFLEEATAMVDTLEEGSAPWMLTLLTVGTHHPYAVPESWSEKHPNDKIAAVHYLDAAMGEFFSYLSRSGRLDDTVVVVVSDESHGIDGQPFGRFWPAAMIRVPGREGGVREGRYGLVDIPVTILGILNIDGAPNSVIPRRDMLADPEGSRSAPLLFERFASPEDGVIYELLQGDAVRRYRPSSGSLFAPSYEMDLLSGDNGAAVQEKILAWRRTEHERLPREGGREEILVIEEGRYALSSGEVETLTTGQYLDIPPETTARIALSMEVAAETGPVGFSLQLLREGTTMELPELSIPTLSPGEKLEFSYSFVNRDSTDRFWMVLAAEHLGEKGEARITVRRFSLELIPGIGSNDRGLERLEITD